MNTIPSTTGEAVLFRLVRNTWQPRQRPAAFKRALPAQAIEPVAGPKLQQQVDQARSDITDNGDDFLRRLREAGL